MKEIVVISGKGGTGKTSLTASFAYMGGSEVVVGDCDVDAADMHLLLQPDYKYVNDFYSGQLAVIEQEKCIACNECAEICRFDAITVDNDQYHVNPLNCEGCGYCTRICPVEAIRLEDQHVGHLYTSNTKAANTMVHARLGVGGENSGKLVAQVKRRAKHIAQQQHKSTILIDGSPGVGCPVISSLTGASFVVIVTEASVSGLHDLKRVHELVKRFKINAACIINKADINPEKTAEINAYLEAEGVPCIATLPYNEDFTKAMTHGLTIVEWNSPLQKTVQQIWNKITQIA